MFDEAIKAAIADGTIKKLSDKWFKIDTTPRADRSPADETRGARRGPRPFRVRRPRPKRRDPGRPGRAFEGLPWGSLSGLARRSAGPDEARRDHGRTRHDTAQGSGPRRGCLRARLRGRGRAGQEWETVKIATEGAYAPCNFTGPGGKLEGFEIDLANDLCDRMKVKCEIIAQDWDGIIPALQATKYDAIMAGMNITDKRLEVMNFSQPYVATPHGWGVLKDSPLTKLPGTGTIISLDKDPEAAKKAIEAWKPLLKGKTVGVQTSTTNSAFLEKYLKDTITIREYKTTEQHDLDLRPGASTPSSRPMARSPPRRKSRSSRTW